MLVVSLSGSPSQQSRSAGLLEWSRRWLSARGVEVVSFGVRDFAAEDLLYGRFDSPQVIELAERVRVADGLLVATPVYKAAYSGALKTLLDLLPERALAHQVVLPLATAGSPAHLLALDYALKPVLAALKAEEVLQGVFADDRQTRYEEGRVVLSGELEQRLEAALEQFYQALVRRPRHLQPGQLEQQLLGARWGV
ncbi:NADPH-dependent FMN reductase [Pseudomonas sp. AN-1]|uniref:NADPH-dependent FMN reductase n=1 Tax=Pseudomonas sp. AN-1 TaxID=3096605 RepID=UPI002A6A5000|nr:NADPH-dependent FMN reductase [Pseudomonas sp. AN-1]WPP46749.1 NADPH-dependent FMN reductase [Pseudomonas sp. AN-1]